MPSSLGKNSVFDRIGGANTCLELSKEFHDRVGQDAELQPLFPNSLGRLIGHFSLFLSERLGGPPSYTASRGKQSLLCRHAHLSISTVQANRWLLHMVGAMDQVGIKDPEREVLHKFFVETAETLTDPFLPYYELPLDQLEALVKNEPTLIQSSKTGHSLLREAVSRWDVPRVRLLLELGADVHAEEPVGHGLVYRAVNAGLPNEESNGGQVLDLLIRCGAAFDRPSGPGKSLPLHMAARRGHVLLANQLLDAGADIEAKDAKGETPLRRAVNCHKLPMVEFLVSRGANPLNPDRQGRTPRDVARSELLYGALDGTHHRR